MIINLEDKIKHENLSTVLELIEDVNVFKTTGKDKSVVKNVNIKNITLKKYCNVFKVSHFHPTKSFNLTDITMEGKYNVIELTDLPKGKFVFNIRSPSNNEDDEMEQKIDNLFKSLEDGGAAGQVVTFKNKTNDNINIGNYDYDKYKLYYVRNLKGKDKMLNLTINYEHNNLKLVLDNINATVVINNLSDSRISCVSEDEILDLDEEEEDEHREIENFGNSKKCTSGGEIILIALIIFAVFKIVTKRQIIKIFD